MASNSKKQREIRTNIKTNPYIYNENIISNLLSNLSSQLSDGHWENCENFYKEYWEWLEFETDKKTGELIIYIVKEDNWKESPNIFKDMSDVEIVHYVGDVLEDCHSLSDVLERVDGYPSEFIEKTIKTLLNYKGLAILKTECVGCKFARKYADDKIANECKTCSYFYKSNRVGVMNG